MKWIYWDNSKCWHSKKIVEISGPNLGIIEADAIFQTTTRTDPKQAHIGTQCIDEEKL